MKQFLQNLSTGLSEVKDIPSPKVEDGKLLIRTRCSLLSSGTERMIVNFAKSNILNKAKQQPEKVKEVIDKFKTDGLINTIEAVNAKLQQPISTWIFKC